MRKAKIRTWSFLAGTGLERFVLGEVDDGFRLNGTALIHDGRSAELRYDLRVDAAWRTRSAEIQLQDGDGERALRLEARDGRWFQDGAELAELRGCVDIDLGWTPSTNLLPIRRLQLPLGASSGVLTAAWVRFPQLTLEPLPQEYRRLAERRYLYSSRGGSFTAELEVDEDGLVLDYQGIWRRVGEDG